jgi:hypothetical protein
LQRLGRSGRRPGTQRNRLFLDLDEDELLLAAGLVLACSRGSMSLNAMASPAAASPGPW